MNTNVESVSDEMLLQIILQTCKTYKDTISFIHNSVYQDWVLVIQNMCKPRKKQLKLLNLVLEIVATKLACNNCCRCLECSQCDQLKQILSAFCLKSKFISVLNKIVSNLQQDQTVSQKELLPIFENLIALSKIILAYFPHESKEALDTLHSTCIALLRVKSPFSQSTSTKLVWKYINVHKKIRRLKNREAENKDTNSKDVPPAIVKNSEEQFDDMEPPQSFRQISVIPTLEELTNDEQPFLRPNKTVGPYKNLDHYLDIQFRLLREDFVRPLRRTVQEFIRNRDHSDSNNCIIPSANPLEKTSVRVYQDVGFLRRENITFDNSTHFIFELPRTHWRRVNWNKSKRLLPGSLVMLTADQCKTAIFGVTVAPPFDPKKARTEGNLNQTRKEISKGILRLAIEEKGVNASVNQKYLMFECEAFFEAYRYNLGILQNMELWSDVDSSQKSLSKFIVEASSDIDFPEYLKTKDAKNYRLSVENDDEGICVDPVNPENWPNETIQTQMSLDTDQYAALKTALTSELAVIQGPPGTGKTYVGLQIVKSFLFNKRLGIIPDSPFLVLCYTNHALDQFLELLLQQFSGLKLVRVGGQSKSELVQEHSLFEHRKKLKASRGGAAVPDDSIMCYDKHFYQYSKYEYAQVRKEGKAIRNMKILEAEHQKIVKEIEKLSNSDGIIDFEETTVNRKIRNVVGNVATVDLWKLMEDTKWLGIEAEDFKRKDFDVRRVLTRLFDLDPSKIEKFGRKGENVVASKEKTEDAISEEITSPELEVEEYDMKELLEHRLLEENFQFEQPEGSEAQIYFQYCSTQQCKQELSSLLNQFKNLHETYTKSERNQVQSDLLQEQVKSFTKLVWEFENRTKFFEALFELYGEGSLNLPDLEERFSMPKSYTGNLQFEFGDILTYSFAVRWAIYFKVLEIALDLSIRHRDEIAKNLSNARKMYSDQRQMLDGSILQNCDIIGMTTTGAAKMHALLEIAKPQIVIVEEAAEILECHIVTALTEDCKQLILIGDHFQLRPTANVFELWSKYRLNVSLFERMILNGVPLCTLKTQHRMRPEIKDLIVGPIYKELHNHPKVHAYPKVKGVKSSLFFVNHWYNEDEDFEIMSKTNFHEASFLVTLCVYLLQQNYQPSQITILTTYTGQMFLIKKLIKAHAPSCGKVRVTSVDNFQGEENDIILLSLVRSNPMNKVGFVGITNRICVALSRARHGLFVIANMKCMTQASNTWRVIYQKLKEGGHTGNALPLQCQRHGHVTYVRESSDFKSLLYGGCGRPCFEKLECGHNCWFFCGHVDNPNHVNPRCYQRCLKYCKVGHQCNAPCFAPCPPCRTFTPKRLPCGHVGRIPCCFEPKSVACRAKVFRKLPCQYNHRVEMECYQDVKLIQCPTKVNKALPCGHVQMVECGLPPDRIKCLEPVDKELRCGHKVKVQCFLDEKLARCNAKVDKELVCGHTKSIRCSTSVKEVKCYKFVDVVMSTCSHSQNIPCHSQSSHKCQAKCEQQLPCGHLCRLTCHLDKDPSHLEYKCKENCEKLCEYDHPCKYTHECFQNCYACATPVKIDLICGHKKEVGCGHRDDLHWCEVKLKKMLPCKHEQWILCQAEPEKQKCGFFIDKCVKKCENGHVCSMGHACGSRCPPCLTNFEKYLECGHYAIMACSENATSYICKEKRRMKCKNCNLEVTVKCATGICKTCEQPSGNRPNAKRSAQKPRQNSESELPKKEKKCSKKVSPNSQKPVPSNNNRKKQFRKR